VYVVDLAGNYDILHQFGETEPLTGSDLLEASDGNVYGGSPFRIFRIDPSGTLTTLTSLSIQGLRSPAALIQGADGHLYGPATTGGADGGGGIFTVDLAGTLTTLYDFTVGAGVAGAGRPNGVIQARDGQFYGTTSGIPGLIPTRRRTGTLFAMDAAGARTTLHTFFIDFPNTFGSPIGSLVEAADGSVYGATFSIADGGIPPGEIFKFSPGGTFTTLSRVAGVAAGLIQARDGRLYGVAGDPIGFFTGGVFRMESNGALTSLHGFSGTTAYPVGELVEIDDGSLYGATRGGSGFAGPPLPPAIFRTDPVTGTFAIRYTFTDGTRPAGRLIQGSDGLIYGTTVNGGTFGLGTVFSLDAAGTLTTLHDFAGADGANPTAGVIQGLDGRLYGTTRNGGVFGYGTVFVMNVTGGLTTLHDFTLSDGANPLEELIQANDGAFYGSASNGGPQGGGVVFRIRLATSPSDQYVEIVSRNSGKCLDIYGASTDAGAPAIQWTCHGGLNQQWRLEPAGGGAFRIIARHSGQALDVFGASLDDVTPIIQWPVHGGDNQVWTLEPASDGHVRIVARHSGKAMDVEFASADDGARVIQYTPHGGANQQWLLRPVEPAALPVMTSSSR
jgi:uncharacterized repeat protein (TIGR03803 family)